MYNDPMIRTQGMGPLSHSTSLNLMGICPEIWTHGRGPLSHSTSLNLMGICPEIWTHGRRPLSFPPHTIWWECILCSEHMEGDLSPLHLTHSDGNVSYDLNTWKETPLPLHLTQSDGNVSCDLNSWKGTSLHSTSHTLMGMFPVIWTHGRGPLSTPPHTIWWECILCSEHIEGGLSPLHLTQSDGNVSCDLNTWKRTSLPLHHT